MVALVARNVRRLLATVSWLEYNSFTAWVSTVSSCFIPGNCRRYRKPPLAQEETQLKQSTQRDVSIVRFCCRSLPPCRYVRNSRNAYRLPYRSYTEETSSARKDSTKLRQADRITEQSSAENSHDDENKQCDGCCDQTGSRHGTDCHMEQRVVVHFHQQVGE